MSTNGGHERRDIDASRILAIGGALAAALVATMIFAWVLTSGLRGREAARSRPASALAGRFGQRQPPEPRLQRDPRVDLLVLRAEETAVLQSYGWVDRNAGIARIPIERAMALLAERETDE